MLIDTVVALSGRGGDLVKYIHIYTHKYIYRQAVHGTFVRGIKSCPYGRSSVLLFVSLDAGDMRSVGQDSTAPHPSKWSMLYVSDREQLTLCLLSYQGSLA